MTITKDWWKSKLTFLKWLPTLSTTSTSKWQPCLLLRCMLCLTICMLDVLIAILSWLPSGEVLHLQDQSLSCGMVLPSYFNPSLTDFQIIKTDIERGSTHPTQMESKADHFSQALWTHMVDVTSDPALMLNFKSEIRGVPTIDLTGQVAVPHYPPLRGNITQDLEDELDAPTTALAIPVINTLFVMNHSQASHLHTPVLEGLQLRLYFSLEKHSYWFIDHEQEGILPSPLIDWRLWRQKRTEPKP